MKQLDYKSILKFFSCNKELSLHLSCIFSNYITFTKIICFYEGEIKRFSYKKQHKKPFFSLLKNALYSPIIRKVYEIEDLPLSIEVLYINEIESEIFNFKNLVKLEVKIFNYNCNCLPASLKELKILDLQTSIRNLPFKLKKLRIEEGFNESLSCLPNSLRYLDTGNDFKRFLDYIPRKLKHLILGHKFNHNLDPLKNLPLKSLKIGISFTGCISNLPNTLLHLEVKTTGKFIDLSGTRLLYFSLENFTNQDFGRFPETLKFLKIENENIEIDSFSRSFCK